MTGNGKPGDVQKSVEEFLDRQPSFAEAKPLPMLSDPVPEISSARLVMEFADGRVVVFEARDPGPAEVQVEHLPPDRTLDHIQAAYPEMISALAVLAPVGGITLRIRAARGHKLRYSEGDSG